MEESLAEQKNTELKICLEVRILYFGILYFGINFLLYS